MKDTNPSNISIQTHEIKKFVCIGAERIQSVDHEDGTGLLEMRTSLLPKFCGDWGWGFSVSFGSESLAVTGSSADFIVPWLFAWIWI